MLPLSFQNLFQLEVKYIIILLWYPVLNLPLRHWSIRFLDLRPLFSLSPPCFSCKISPTAWWWQWLLTSRSLVTPSCDRGGILWLAKWCINGFILVHEYTFTFNSYVVIQYHTQIHVQRQFSVTNIFIYSCNISSFTFKVKIFIQHCCYIHSTVC